LNRIRALIVLVLALFAATLFAACGGDDNGGGDEDPQQVLDATFSNDQAINSGVFDLSFDISAEGGSDPGTFSVSFGGPFQGTEGQFPQFDVDGAADLDSETQDFSGEAGLTSTGDTAFISFQGSDYEIPQKAFRQFTSRFLKLQKQSEQQSQGQGNFLASLGIDPRNWLTDLSNEGTEDVEGTETVHITGQADVEKLVQDLRKIAKNAPQATGQLTPQQLSQLDQLTDVIESADFDIYSGADDDVLRKLEGSITVKPSAGDGSPESADINFSLTLSEVNEPQQIAAPATAQPLARLLQQFGVDPRSLAQLGDVLGGAGGGAGLGTPQAGGSPTPPSSDASQAYLQCLQSAQDAAALQKCAALLQQ
jgi:hypothetical protein